MVIADPEVATYKKPLQEAKNNIRAQTAKADQLRHDIVVAHGKIQVWLCLCVLLA
jgi:hypothetical protein